MNIDLPAISFAPGSVPMWGTFFLLVTTIGGLLLKHRKMTLDTDGGIRDHYAKEVASLRQQVLAVQAAADLRMASAEKRYAEAIEAADKRHAHCEEECERLRDTVMGMERKYAQLNSTMLRMFELRDTLPEDLKIALRSLEQRGLAAGHSIGGPDPSFSGSGEA